MAETLRKVLDGVLDRLREQITTLVPPVLVALIVLLAAYLMAISVRWLLYRLFKGLAMDRFLRQSGLAFVIDPKGRLRATRVVAEGAYWFILVAGALTGLSAFGTDLAAQIIQNMVFLLPKLVVAGLILLAGAWLSDYLGRGAVGWAVQEGLPWPRRLSALVRVILMFAAVVVAADYLDFARNVFLAAFIIVAGGVALASSIAIGLVSGRDLRRMMDESPPESREPVGSRWNDPS